jgi:hypothetical protein
VLQVIAPPTSSGAGFAINLADASTGNLPALVVVPEPAVERSGPVVVPAVSRPRSHALLWGIAGAVVLLAVAAATLFALR